MQLLCLFALTLFLAGPDGPPIKANDGTLGPRTSQPEVAVEQQTAFPTTALPTGYVLGSGDQISLRILGVEEISDKPMAVDLNGYLHIPLAGQIRASGLTIQQLESEIESRLKTYVLRPDVSISIIEFRSQPVSVIGAVKNPGTLQLRGRKTLLEILSEAGGVDNANAGSILKITRRKEWGAIPLPNAQSDATKQFSVAQISIKSLISAFHPEENIQIKPYDVVSVPRADTVYVIGEVVKSGGFLLSDNTEVTVLQALSMAGGLDKMAQPKEARILRRTHDRTERTEIPVNIKNMLTGTIPDVEMKPDDILFVPNNIPKRAAVRAIEAAVQMGTGVIIFRRP
jgi:polysaccharide biosynthesis/export protein